MNIVRYFTPIASPIICCDKSNTQWLKESQKTAAGCICSWPENMRYDLFPLCIKGIPQPVTVLFTADTRPLLINFTNKSDIFIGSMSCCYLPWCEFFNVRMTVFILIFNTRPESRTPEPFITISTIFSLIPGL